LLEAFIADDAQRLKLLQGSTTVPTIAAKNVWAAKWIANKECSFAERLIAFACVEGIYFSSSFALIFKLKSLNKMPGLAQSNDLISRDEGLHTEFACALIRGLRLPPDAATVKAIVEEAVDIETSFAKGQHFHDSLPDDG
jgi:ribonucleoside-diphosphate reductase subunit M2